MSVFDLNRQYERFLDQLEKEVGELYWLYNFFFIANAAFLGFSFSKLPVRNEYYFIAGVLLSLLWFLTFNKQRLWRDGWIVRIYEIEADLSIPEKYRFFKNKKPSSFLVRWGKALWPFYHDGISKVLVLVPFFFVLMWVYYFYQDNLFSIILEFITRFQNGQK